MIGETIVTGDCEGYIFIGNYKTGESVGPVSKHNDAVECISAHPTLGVA